MTDHPPVHEAWSAVMTDVSAIRKNDRNDFHKFMFRGIDAVLNAVGPALRNHGMFILPELHRLESRDTLTDKQKTQREVTIWVRYTIHGPAGDTMTTMVPGESADTGDKAVSKAMSVAYRTMLLQALTIPTDETDPDAGPSPGRGVNPLTAVKVRLAKIAESQSHDLDWLRQDFGIWSQGDVLGSADLETLTRYADHLAPEPVQRVSRGTSKTTVRRAAPEPAEPEFDTEPQSPAPDGITPAQLKMLHASFSDKGFRDRQDRLNFVATLDIEVESSKDLSKNQASRVIDALQQLSDVTP